MARKSLAKIEKEVCHHSRQRGVEDRRRFERRRRKSIYISALRIAALRERKNVGPLEESEKGYDDECIVCWRVHGFVAGAVLVM